MKYEILNINKLVFFHNDDVSKEYTEKVFSE
jgi:hypothetical protein